MGQVPPLAPPGDAHGCLGHLRLLGLHVKQDLSIPCVGSERAQLMTKVLKDFQLDDPIACLVLVRFTGIWELKQDHAHLVTSLNVALKL